MKPAFFAIGLSMLVGLGACAAPFGETADEGNEAREESVKSADQDSALAALRSRVQEDFASAPALHGYEIVVVANRIQGGPDQIAIQGHVMKRRPGGMAIELGDEDFVVDGVAHKRDDIKVASEWRSEVTAIMVNDGNGNWSTLKHGLLSSGAIEAYISGQTPDEFEGWTASFRSGSAFAKRSKL